jgi:hypothetical protein
MKEAGQLGKLEIYSPVLAAVRGDAIMVAVV